SAVSSARNPVSSAALVAFLVAMGSGMSVPKPSAGIAPAPLARANFVERRLSGFIMFSVLHFSQQIALRPSSARHESEMNPTLQRLEKPDLSHAKSVRA